MQSRAYATHPYMPKDQTVEGKRVAADAAKNKADAAKAAAAAKPDDAGLKTAADEAQAEAARLEALAAAPSHEPKPGDLTKKDKIKRRMEILREQYISEGGDSAEFDDDEAGDKAADDNKPLTRKDLQSMGIVKSADQLASDIADAELRSAVADELKYIDKSLPAQQRFDKAVSLASSSKNARIASEARRINASGARSFGNGQGSAPPRQDDAAFAPTAQEAVYMNKFKLTKEDVLRAREQAQGLNFGGK